MECDFCKKTFLSKNVLSHHQKTAKYCLELQGTNVTNFECNYCKKYLASNERLVTHLNICKSKNIIEISEKEKQHENKLKEKDTYYEALLKDKNNYITKIEQEKNDCITKIEQDHRDKLQEKNDYIAKLETKIEKMESKLEAKLEKLESTVTTIALESKTPAKAAPTTNNTTNLITVTNNNFLNLSQEHIKKVLAEKLDFNVVYAGQAGLAKFVVDYMLTDEDGNVIYHCVDPSRQTFEFIDEKGEKVRDVKAEKLIQSLLKGDVIRLGLEEAAKGWNTDDNSLNLERTTVFGSKVSEYAELNRNNTVFRSKVSSLTA
jgi:hypothetical protein